MALGDDQLRAIQECESTKAAWDKLQARYAGKTIGIEIGVLNS